jgi:hypothetical protein
MVLLSVVPVYQTTAYKNNYYLQNKVFTKNSRFIFCYFLKLTVLSVEFVFYTLEDIGSSTCGEFSYSDCTVSLSVFNIALQHHSNRCGQACCYAIMIHLEHHLFYALSRYCFWH